VQADPGIATIAAIAVLVLAERPEPLAFWEEVRAEARQQSIGSLDDIRYAVLETNGKISFLT